MALKQPASLNVSGSPAVACDLVCQVVRHGWGFCRMENLAHVPQSPVYALGQDNIDVNHFFCKIHRVMLSHFNNICKFVSSQNSHSLVYSTYVSAMFLYA